MTYAVICWKGFFFTCSPFTNTLPSSEKGFFRLHLPANMLSIVVLPAPEAPIIAVRLPGSNDAEMLFSNVYRRTE